MKHNKAGAEFAVAYDISDDRERRRVEKILLGFGFRIQKSVFECRLTRSGQHALLGALEQLRLETGSVKMYRIYAGAHARVVGQPTATPDDGLAFTW